jgi:type I restriction enzyme, S subunit
MEVKPGYRQTEVGVIPEDWSVKMVGDVCGFIVPGRNKPRHFDGEIPWVTTPDLEDGRGVSASRIGLCVSRAEAQAIGSRVVPVGSVLMSCAGELGITAITRNEIVVNQQLHAFIPSPQVNAAFLLNVIALQKPQIGSLATKTAVPYLNKNNCNSIHIQLPPVAEQDAIAEALSDADTLIESLEQLATKKRQLKQGAMQELLTGKKRLPGFSGEWEVKRLGEIAHVKTGGRNNQDKIEEGEYPFFVRSATVERINSYSYDCEAILVPGEGGIGNIFHYIRGRFDVHQRVYAITQFSTETSGRFVYFYMAEKFGTHAMQNSVKATVDSLRLPMFQNFELVMPPTIEEQTAIAAILSDMDDEIAALEAKLAKARQIKQGMMQELLTGRIRLV